MLQKVMPTHSVLVAKRNNRVVLILVGLFRAGAFLVAVGETCLDFAVLAVAALGVQRLLGY
jgi:hypothetical protein